MGALKAFNELKGAATIDMKPLTIKPCPLPAMEAAVQERDAVLKSTPRMPPFSSQENKPEEIKPSDSKENVQVIPPLKNTPQIKSKAPQNNKPEDIKKDIEKNKSQDMNPNDSAQKDTKINQNSKNSEPPKTEKKS